MQLFDLDEAIAEMTRVKQLEAVGICIPATAPPDHLYSDPWYDKFWAAAQDLRMPLNMPIFTGATPEHGLAPRQAGSRANGPMSFAGAAMTIADLIQSGVCERFPDIRFVVTEFETGWVAHVLKRLDWAYVRAGGERAFGLPMLPSQYWRRNFAVTFEDDPLGIMTRDFIGTDTMMWGNDYPHGDSIFPHSQRVLGEIDPVRLHAGGALEDDGQERHRALRPAVRAGRPRAGSDQLSARTECQDLAKLDASNSGDG